MHTITISSKAESEKCTDLPAGDPDTVDSASSDSSITSSNSSGNGKWVCSICGYVYDGDIPFEELPDTFVCPICKQGKDKFKQR